MARNFFGQGLRSKRQEQREMPSREQAERREAQLERQRAMLRGERDPQITYTLDETSAEESVSTPTESVEEAPVVSQPSQARRPRSDQRPREDARIGQVQQQIDTLLSAVRELQQLRDDDLEIMKSQQGEISRLQIALEKASQDYEQSAQAAALNENRTRQQLDDLQVRLDDSTRPIRSLQAHVTDLLEQSRRRVDDSNQNKERYSEIATSLEHLTAINDRTTSVAHTLRDSLDALRGEIDELRRDVIRTDDAVKIVDQEARRRTAGVGETIEGYAGKLDEIRSDISHAFESIEDTRRAMVHVDPTLEELRAGDVALRTDFSKAHTQLSERHDQIEDTVDDFRQETDARFDQLRHTLEERIERLNERLEETNTVNRETTYKISELNAQIEDLRQVDASLHRDVWYLHEQRVRVRLEQVQEELDLATAQRRDAEGEARVGLGNRVRRRRGEVATED